VQREKVEGSALRTGDNGRFLISVLSVDTGRKLPDDDLGVVHEADARQLGAGERRCEAPTGQIFPRRGISRLRPLAPRERTGDAGLVPLPVKENL
jgi:hypothetical protein